MDAVELDDFRWLIGPDARQWLQRAMHHQGSTTALAKTLRRQLTSSRARLVLEQAALRRRATVKFRRAGEMFFTARLLEQATDDVVADYKATRFPAGEPIIDCCCGIGGDLQSLSRRAPCQGIDRDPVAVILAAANAELTATHPVTTRCQAVTADALPAAARWHIDPDRRATGRRATHLEALEPAWKLVQSLRQRHADGGAKIAPATEIADHDVSDVPAEREWIESRGECRQQMVWWGQLARTSSRAATLVHPDGRVDRLVGRAPADTPCCDQPLRYVYEPRPCVLAARLGGLLAAEHQLSRLPETAACLTGDSHLPIPLTSAFEVQEVLPLDLKRLRGLFRQRRWSVREVKQRGAGVEPGELQRRLKANFGQPMSLLVLGSRRGRRVIVARRL